ncbi:RNA-guided pseudouridylation complex pseudouridine synthase subunit Cbf5 [Candidatus Woesearchaeota archaeon]|nr:RNA-guided pseudouridylation complex pseudouridine synthase subunit Cbf5 [Candidatus Woesearchaeota archaeon]
MGDLPWERIERETLVRKKARSDEKFGRDPAKTPTEELLERGVVVIDKPAGPTSHQVSDYLKKILKVPKAGHSGTLDPAVTGVLPTAIGSATRIAQALLTSGKEYICHMHLHAEKPEEEVRKVMEGFIGKIKQLPPVKSAVKRQWRYRKIYYLEFLEVTGKDVLFIVGCQAGTYIRKLCHDIGEKLGCGAHMAGLRRSKAGPYNESQLVTLQDVTDARHYWKSDGDDSRLRKLLLPIESAVFHLPKVWVLDTAVDALCHGVNLKAPGISKVETDIQVDEDVAVMTLKGELVLVGKAKMISKDMQTEERGLAIKTDQVFMEPGTYPKKE